MPFGDDSPYSPWFQGSGERWGRYNLPIYGYGSIPINTIFSGMNIHLPAILMFTRGTIGFDTLPYMDVWIHKERIDTL